MRATILLNLALAISTATAYDSCLVDSSWIGCVSTRRNSASSFCSSVATLPLSQATSYLVLYISIFEWGYGTFYDNTGESDHNAKRQQHTYSHKDDSFTPYRDTLWGDDNLSAKRDDKRGNSSAIKYIKLKRKLKLKHGRSKPWIRLQ
ncbi:hypothetical protein ONZ43_g6746 [Nemania bipapillata]|uniref:Uncharacterized protein n=1 Tax=Nemania bipapillata TaxID=110536 RepID=A0ACC2HX56_9PEZI|nr:hypothetical protein ONZ43_g6746 [Nemania bipapillata]